MKYSPDRIAAAALCSPAAETYPIFKYIDLAEPLEGVCCSAACPDGGA